VQWEKEKAVGKEMWWEHQVDKFEAEINDQKNYSVSDIKKKVETCWQAGNTQLKGRHTA